MNDETPIRTARQILDDLAAGKLEQNQIHVRETARLQITDVETGAVTERTIVADEPVAIQRPGEEPSD